MAVRRDSRNTRPVSWIKAARKAFDDFPRKAQDEILRALTVAADGGFPEHMKPMKGLGSVVYEVALRHRTEAYRTVYTLEFRNALWVVHAFQKKSKSGIGTPKHEVDLITDRIKRLKEVLK